MNPASLAVSTEDIAFLLCRVSLVVLLPPRPSLLSQSPREAFIFKAAAVPRDEQTCSSPEESLGGLWTSWVCLPARGCRCTGQRRRRLLRGRGGLTGPPGSAGAGGKLGFPESRCASDTAPPARAQSSGPEGTRRLPRRRLRRLPRPGARCRPPGLRLSPPVTAKSGTGREAPRAAAAGAARGLAQPGEPAAPLGGAGAARGPVGRGGKGPGRGDPAGGARRAGPARRGAARPPGGALLPGHGARGGRRRRPAGGPCPARPRPAPAPRRRGSETGGAAGPGPASELRRAAGGGQRPPGQGPSPRRC